MQLPTVKIDFVNNLNLRLKRAKVKETNEPVLTY